MREIIICCFAVGLRKKIVKMELQRLHIERHKSILFMHIGNQYHSTDVSGISNLSDCMFIILSFAVLAQYSILKQDQSLFEYEKV